MKETCFSAPWGAPLKILTVVCIAICLFAAVPGFMLGLGKSSALRALGMREIPPALQWAGWFLVVTMVLTLVGSAAFMVRGYVLSEGCLRIQRAGWETRLNLARLVSAKIDPDALHGSIRLFGNGGCFAFVGWFRNKTLGSYRAYLTDAKRTVVLRFSDRTVVVSPGEPEKFVAEISSEIRIPL